MIGHPRDVVSCVIVNYNRRDDTLACLQSLHEMESVPHIIIVDNGSTDGSVAAFKSLPQPATLIEAGRNLGFGKGANLGIREALRRGSSYIWLLNNDTLVAPDSLAHLLRTLEEAPSVGGVASVILRMSDRTIEAYGGGSVNEWLGTTRPFASPKTRRLDYLACASALVRSDVFNEVGLFDEVFFAYYEDIDLSLRLRSAGWGIAVAPSSTIRHRGAATTNEGEETRSLWGDLVYVESAGAFLGKHMDPRKVVGTPLRLLAMIGVRIARRQWRRLPIVVVRFLRGFRRGYSSARRA